MKIKMLRDLRDIDNPLRDLDLQALTKYAYPDDVGIDLIACQGGWVPASGWISVPTGVAIEFPASTFGLILPRSGIAKKLGIGVLGGVIDSGFRGEIIVNLINNGTEGWSFAVGAKIAQLVVLPYHKVSLEWVSELGSTERGRNGLGSTGY